MFETPLYVVESQRLKREKKTTFCKNWKSFKGSDFARIQVINLMAVRPINENEN